MRECSRKRPITEMTRTLSVAPGTPAASTEKPLTIRLIGRPAREARTIASHVSRSSSWFISMIRAGRPARWSGSGRNLVLHGPPVAHGRYGCGPDGWGKFFIDDLLVRLLFLARAGGRPRTPLGLHEGQRHPCPGAYIDSRAVQDRLDDDYECLPDGSVVCRLRC